MKLSKRKKNLTSIALMSSIAVLATASITYASYVKTANVGQDVGSSGYKLDTLFLYAKSNEGDWASDGAIPFIYAWDDTANTTIPPAWYESVGVNTSDTYYFHLPLRVYTHVIFVRLNPSFESSPRFNQDGDPANNKPVWNQTGNLQLSGRAGDCFRLSTFTTGSWGNLS